MVCSAEWYIFVALLIAVAVRLLGQDLAPLIDAVLPIVRALHPVVALPLDDVPPIVADVD